MLCEVREKKKGGDKQKQGEYKKNVQCKDQFKSRMTSTTNATTTKEHTVHILALGCIVYQPFGMLVTKAAQIPSKAKACGDVISVIIKCGPLIQGTKYKVNQLLLRGT